MKNKLMILANDETTIYNFRREIIRAFHEHGYEVILSLPEGEHTKELEDCGCKVVNTAVSRHGKNPLHDLQYMQTCRPSRSGQGPTRLSWKDRTQMEQFTRLVCWAFPVL